MRKRDKTLLIVLSEEESDTLRNILETTVIPGASAKPGPLG
jgi:hypothetical protein